MTKETTREELLDRLHEVVSTLDDEQLQDLVERLELRPALANGQPCVLRFVNEPELYLQCARLPEREERCQRIEQGWRRESILIRIDSVVGEAQGELRRYMDELVELSEAFLCPWTPGSGTWSYMMSDGKEFECRLDVE